MTRSLDPFRFVLIAVSGWMSQQQLELINYLREESRVLREQLGGKRLRFNDDQRRRLAAKAKGLGRKLLQEVATIVTPETLLAWHRRLIAQKGSGANGTGISDDSQMPRFVPVEELFKGRHFNREIVVLCVRWYLSFKLSSGI